MGVGLNIAEICAIEHASRPLGRVLLFGRQTMFFSREQAAAMVRARIPDAPAIDPATLALDRQTIGAGSNNIRDDEFFRLLGLTDIRSMDKSDYEGADIIHDLNTPIPADLEGTVDFILDGSTLDNVWDPAMAIRNMARLLSPGGRIVSVNMASNHNAPYTVLSPTWVLDYFVVNRFADCRVALSLIRDDGAFCAYSLDLDQLDRHHIAHNFTSPYQMGLMFVAEKAAASTWHRTPSQQQYRSAAEWDEYEAQLGEMRKMPPRSIWGSNIGPLVDPPARYRFEPGGWAAPVERPRWWRRRTN